MPGIDSYTELMLHCNGTDASTSFPDDSGNSRTVTAIGTAQVDIAQSKFGGASALFDGNSDYLSVTDFAELDLGSADFTFDFWVRFTSISGNQAFFGRYDSGSSYFYCAWESGANFRFRDYNNANLNCTLVWSPAPVINTWYHVAVVRTVNTVRVFINGAQLGADYTTSGSTIARTTPLTIGAVSGISYYLNGWIDEFRFSPGIARWTTNFTPPTEEYSLPIESVDISDTVTLSENWELDTNPNILDLSETLTLSENWSVEENPKFEILNETITLSESWNFLKLFHKIINTNLDWKKLYTNAIKISLNWIIAKSINTNLTWLGVSRKIINTDLRWLSLGYNDVPPIAPANIQILINGVDMVVANDVDLQSGNIQHTIGQKSTASFTLARKHDDLDRTHAGAASQITNQNAVQIYIQGHLEFDGKISNLVVNSETETIQVTCLMDEPPQNRHTIDIPLPSVNEKIHLYHCLVNNVTIDNPYIDPGETNPEYYKGIKVDLGTKIQQQTDTWRDLEYQMNNTTITQADVESEGLVWVDTKNILLNNNWGKESFGGSVDLDKKQIIIDKNGPTLFGSNWGSMASIIGNITKGEIAQQIEDGTFIPRPNYNYFWNVMAKNIRTGSENVDFRYVGTSLGSLATDLWVVNGVSPLYQKIKDNIEIILGYYYVGTAPYKEISSKNGKLIIAAKYQDRDDGLYHVYPESYNYIDFAKLVAGLEYQKLLNINGQILPITSANIDITFDAYYYYTVKLLTRINVTNTTVANTFKNSNGFPTSVKGITINFSIMKITLSTDNRLSQDEIDEIDAQMPDEENPIYLVPEYAARVGRKFDLKTWSYVS